MPLGVVMADLDLTVGELADLIIRQRQALTEARCPDLAEHVHIVVTGEGDVRLSYSPTIAGRIEDAPPEMMKALGIDPSFEYGGLDDGG